MTAKKKPAPKAPDTKPASAGMDHKQQSANYQRSMAVRTGGESVIAPEPDAEAAAGKERASALSPDDRKRANAESKRSAKAGAGATKETPLPTEEPMGDEVPVSGLDDTPKGRTRPDGDPAKEVHMTGSTKASAKADTKADAKESAARDGESPLQTARRNRQREEGKLADQAKAMTVADLADALPVGSEIRVDREGVTIKAAIAGGGVRVYGGKTLHEAMAAMQAEAIHGPQTLAGDDEARLSPDPAKTAEAEGEDAAKRGTAAKTAGARKSSAKKASARKSTAKAGR